MQSLHVHQRDDRRRRVLAEERAVDAPPLKTTTRPTKRSAEPYSDSARQEHQRRVTELVPRSQVSLGLLGFCGLTMIAGLVAGYLYLPELAAWSSKDAVAALELGGRGSLAAWFGSLLLGLAAAGSLMVYSVRRHKVDDYRGHYRWWLLAAVAWLVMSVDATSGIHDLFAAALTKLTGYKAPAAGNLWWVGSWGVVVGAIVTRLLLDMRSCKAAFVAVLSAMIAWIVALTMELGKLQLPGVPAPVVCETAKLLGHLLLLFGVTQYARHVILHAQGLLPVKQPKQRAAKKETKHDARSAGTAAGTSPDEAVPAKSASADKRTDLPTTSATPHPHFSSGHAAKPAAIDDDESADDTADDEDDDDQGQRRLTKADRKRLRKKKSTDREW